MINKTLSLGKRGEAAVSSYLQKQGFTIRALNYFCKKGEIDIIAEKDNTRLFVEVKTRQTAYFETSQVVNFSKQRKMVMTAQHYNAMIGRDYEQIYRFDVALLEEQNGDFAITYIPNAFEPPEELAW